MCHRLLQAIAIFRGIEETLQQWPTSSLPDSQYTQFVRDQVSQPIAVFHIYRSECKADAATVVFEWDPGAVDHLTMRVLLTD